MICDDVKKSGKNILLSFRECESIFSMSFSRQKSFVFKGNILIYNNYSQEIFRRF